MLWERLSICFGVAVAMFAVTPVTAASGERETELHQAAALGHAEAIRGLLDKGAAIDARNAKGETALLIATHANHVDAARVLIEAGADVNAKDKINDSPYLYAGARGHNEILQMTLAHGADLLGDLGQRADERVVVGESLNTRSLVNRDCAILLRV